MEIERGLVRTSAGYIHYRAAGAGKPILLMHANQRSSALHLEALEVLGRQVRAISMDHPSHGMSDHLAQQPTIADYARYASEVLDALAIGKATVLGESASAAIAVEFANTFPARTEGIVMVNCPFWQKRETEGHNQVLQKMRGQRPADATGFPVTRTLEFVLQNDPEHAPLHPTQVWMDRINVAQLEAGRDRWQALDALARYDVPPNLERLRCPVLLLNGEHFIYLKFLAEFTRRIKHARHETVAAGRFDMLWEHPEQVGAAILRFMA